MTSNAARGTGSGGRTCYHLRLVTPDEQLPSTPLAVANISLESVNALPARLDTDTLVTSGYFMTEEPDLSMLPPE